MLLSALGKNSEMQEASSDNNKKSTLYYSNIASHSVGLATASETAWREEREVLHFSLYACQRSAPGDTHKYSRYFSKAAFFPAPLGGAEVLI